VSLYTSLVTLSALSPLCKERFDCTSEKDGRGGARAGSCHVPEFSKLSAAAVWELFEVFVDGGAVTLGLEKRDLLPRVAIEDDMAPSLTAQVCGATTSPHPEHLCGLSVLSALAPNGDEFGRGTSYDLTVQVSLKKYL
jgi:hypothetical protein